LDKHNIRKKGIVLLITIFFISAISILILQNIKDTEQLLDNSSYNSDLSQVQITIQNIKDEIPKFLTKNKANIDIILEKASVIPFKYGNVDLVLNIEDINGSNLIKCNYTIKVNDLICKASLTFDLQNSNIKDFNVYKIYNQSFHF
jgi:hypothetical protein